MKLTKLEIAKIGMDFDAHYYDKKYWYDEVVTYKYNGEIKTRVEHHETQEHKDIAKLLDDYPVFQCPCCKRMVTFGDLEYWTGDGTLDTLMNDEITCSSCYEDEMGDDL